jgi:RNA polymerase sigma-70 factor (ECF subfamily)
MMISGISASRKTIGIRDNSRVADKSQTISEACYDPVAFVQLYRKYYDQVFRYCAHRLFDRNTAEDITSQVFLKVVQSFGRFNDNGQPQFRNWLYRVATNEVNNHLRKQASRNGLFKRFGEQTNDGTNDPESSAEELAILKKAIFALKPKYQTVITLRFFENLKLTEIADVLGCSPGTARSRLARALAKIRKKLTAAGITRLSGGAEND